MLSRSPWLVSTTVIAIFLSHYVVDVFSSIVPPLIGVVEAEFKLRPDWSAILVGLGSICSGLAQPLFAWLSDRTGSRIFGPLGVLLAALGICCIGYLDRAQTLFWIYSIAMMGVGMFHPIATARVGQIAGDQRSLAISLFFVFGMAGFFTGSLVGPRLTTGTGNLKSLMYLLAPGLVMAIVLQICINRHATPQGGQISRVPLFQARYDWRSIGLLYASCCCRFLVNTAIIYLIVRWAEQDAGAMNPNWNAKKISDIAAPIAGQTHAVMFLGQALGGMVAGALIKLGNERLPLIATPIFFGPALCALAVSPPGLAAYAACFIGGIGFAAMTPISISKGQQLMPHHTRLASGLMLGGAWAVASVGPRIAEFLITTFSLEFAIIATGLTLIMAGVSAVGIRENRPDLILPAT